MQPLVPESLDKETNLTNGTIDKFSESSVSFYYHNVGGLRTKTQELFKNALTSNYDFIILTETWLNNSFADAELFPLQYAVFRSDRDYEATNLQRGGGVLIATNNDYQSSLIDTVSFVDFEQLWIQSNCNGHEVVIGVVYIPPSSSEAIYKSFVQTCESLKDSYRNATFLVFGDFNLPYLNWIMEDYTLIPEATYTAAEQTLIDSMFFMELDQLNSIKNGNNRSLDLIFASALDSHGIKRSSFPLCSVIDIHPPLELDIKYKGHKNMKNTNPISVYLFKKANYVQFNEFLSNINWENLLQHSDPNVAVAHFYEVIYQGIDLFVPKKIFKTNKYPKWFNYELKRQIGHKNKLYRKYRRSRSGSDYRAYSIARRNVKYHTDMCYLLHVTKTQHLIPSNVKHFWSYIKSLRRDAGLPSLMQLDDVKTSDPKQIAELFAKHFKSCFSVHTDEHLNGNYSVDFGANLSDHTFATEEIKEKILNLDTSKSPGPDGLSPIFLRECCSSLLNPLKQLFQLSFDTGIFPTTWKISNLIPIYKSGENTNIKNYRGISLLSHIPKIMESILTDDIYSCYKNYIADEQHGFCQGKSTATNLACYQQALTTALESGKQVDVIYTDVSKAFDGVCHKILLEKLSCIGFNDHFLSWTRSYLTGRQQRVNMCGVLSHEFSVPSGVPQGSHIGPILFVLFINDVVRCLKGSRCLLYADDLKFFATVDSECNPLQPDLDRLANWCNINLLKLNPKKCKHISFYKTMNPVLHTYFLENERLETVDTIKDLGVVFQKDLSFSRHIDNIVLKGFRLLGFIKRNTRDIYDVKAITTLYYSLIRSTLEYCSIIWTPNYNCHIQRIERVQNKFVKYLLYKLRFPYQNVDYNTRLLLCGLTSLENRRQNAQLIFLYKLMCGITYSPELLQEVHFLAPGRRTRQRQLFFQPVHRTNYGQNCLMTRLLTNYNSYFSHLDLFYLTLSSVKKAIAS